MNGLLLSKLVLLCGYKLVQAGERVGFNYGFNLRGTASTGWRIFLELIH